MAFEEGVHIYGNITLETCHGLCVILFLSSFLYFFKGDIRNDDLSNCKQGKILFNTIIIL